MARSFSTDKASTEAQQQYIHDIQVALVGTTQSMAKVAEARSKLPVASAAEASRKYRASVDFLSKFNQAINAGTGAAAVNALADLTIDKHTVFRADEAVLDKAQAAADANPNWRVGSPERNRAAWQQFAKVFNNPGAGARTLETVKAMEAAYGKPDDAVWASDSGVKAKIADAYAAATKEQSFQDIATGANDAILGAKALKEANGGKDVGEAEASKFLNNVTGSVRSAVGLQEQIAYARANANKEDELVGAMKSEYDKLDTEYDSLDQQRKDLLEQTHPESERDEAARIIALPRFQAWAEANGFHVGTVEPATPGQTYNAGVVTPAGVYIPGPDDYKALRFAERQMNKSPDEAHPFLHNAVQTTPTYGRVVVSLPGAPTKHADGEYHYIVNGDGTRKYITPEEQAQYVTAGVDVQAFHTTADAPPEHTEEIRGKMQAPWAGDPEGSIRISDRLYTADQLVSPPVVTSGGKDKPLKAFLKEYKQRRDTNVQTRQENASAEERVPFNAASWLAQTLTPAVQSVQDAKTDEERTRAAEMLRRAQEEAAQQVADMTGRDKADVMQEIRAGKDYNAYVETDREQLDSEAAAKDKILSKLIEQEQAQRVGTEQPSSFTPTSEFVRQPETMVPQTPAPVPSKADQRAALYAAGKNAKGGDLLYQTNAPAPRGLAGDTMPTKFDREDTAPKAAPGPKPTTPYEEQGLQASRARLPAAKADPTTGVRGVTASSQREADKLQAQEEQRAKLFVPSMKDVYDTRSTRSPEEQRAAYMRAAKGKDPYKEVLEQ
jgi:hypothetical protein